MAKKMIFISPKENEVSFEDTEPEIAGIVMQYGKDDYSFWDGFSLTSEEKEQIQCVLRCHETEGYSVRGSEEKEQIQCVLRCHETEGYSVRGSKEEILTDISNPEKTSVRDKIERNIRKCLDEIYNESTLLPENFGGNILEELKERFSEDGYEITKKTVLEEMLWCYMSRMQ